ncbi:MAG: right-handed parallel beta-helix repeat-containing protein [Bacteroidales bacterium]|nr:right-handed parallel beta-helix repeat-containing protein [Bacteroidales bacterium]
MKNQTITYIVTLLIVVYSSFGYAGTIVVTNTNDSGTGSLRQAMTDAETNPGADTIVFDIPLSDNNYNSTTGVWTIQPATDFPQLKGDSTLINGNTQTLNQGNRNTEGPEIEINGTNVTSSAFIIRGSGNTIQGLIINRSPVSAISIKGNRNIVSGNYLGTDASGNIAVPNGYGVSISGVAKHNSIGGALSDECNLISGNANWGIQVLSVGADSNMIKGNYIGTNASGNDTLCNFHGGIFLRDGSCATIIGGNAQGEGNVIGGSVSKTGASIFSGNGITILQSNNNRITGNYIGTCKNAASALYNKKYGILIQEGQNNIIGGIAPGEANVISGYYGAGIIIRMSGSKNNVISGNYIGTGSSGLIYCEHCKQGIQLMEGAGQNIIGPENIISNNKNYGISCQHDSTTMNTFTTNSIFNNGGKGIYNDKGGNTSLPAPLILDISSGSVTGTACADCIVEIFSDSLDEGAIFEGTTMADATGNFAWAGTVEGPHVTATATDINGNTSEFSDPFIIPEVVYVTSRLAEEVTLEQNMPNPFSTITEIRYSVAVSGHVRLRIFDLSGREIRRPVDEYHLPGEYSITWDAKDFNDLYVPGGVYYYVIQSGSFILIKKMVFFSSNLK